MHGKSPFRLAVLRNSLNMRLCTPASRNKEDRFLSETFSSQSHKNDVLSVAHGVCRRMEIGPYTGLIGLFVDPGVEINGICYCGLFMLQNLLPAF